jgi:hypothetical protein
MRSGVFVAKPPHPLRPIFRRYAVFRLLAEIRPASNDTEQVSDPMLEPRVREHHSDRAREGSQAGMVRIREKDCALW